ncbi:hypothetical protein B0H19DRAFT_1277472 [Mycena capillaripes]|nr:hypothetical protein B0H19DRAFT_1277472 [Mycena capillaripes]
MMVTEDDAFMLVDKGPFRRLLQYCRPNLKESDIAHRTKMREEILKRTEEAEERLQSKLQASFTFDTWTSKTGDPFPGVTGHYIDAPADTPEDFSFRSEQLAYTPIEGKSTLIPFTRCMEHAVHLTAGHFISDVSPLSAKAVLAKAKKLRKKFKAENPDMDDGELDALLAAAEGDEDDGYEDVDEYGEDGPAPKDAVGKALALVKQIRVSPQAQAFFKKISSNPTVWRTLPLLEALAETLGNMAATTKFEDMRDSINAGLENLEKWYGKTDDIDVYLFCLALDPNIKTAYAEESWNSVAFAEGLEGQQVGS